MPDPFLTLPNRLTAGRVLHEQLGCATWVLRQDGASVLLRSAEGDLELRCGEGETRDRLHERATRLADLLNYAPPGLW